MWPDGDLPPRNLQCRPDRHAPDLGERYEVITREDATPPADIFVSMTGNKQQSYRCPPFLR